MLRRSSSPTTAAALAAELETSKRSVYRGIASLTRQRVLIRGEAGARICAAGRFDISPLMLISDEVEAAVLGAQWVTGHGDLLLARAARDLIAKTTATMPETLRPLILDASARTPPDWKTPPDGIDIARARGWVRFGRRSRSYRDNEDRKTDRIIWANRRRRAKWLATLPKNTPQE
jgi:predicted DNA-binding transcriptional regulator YafY